MDVTSVSETVGDWVSVEAEDRRITRRTETLQLGLWMFLATVVMLFAAFTSAYIVRRSGTDWRPVALPGILWLNTVVLLASSVVLEIGRRGGGVARWLSPRAGLGAAALLGIVFLVGQVAAWQSLVAQGVYLPTNPHSSFIYIMTGAHALHLVAALAFVFVTLMRVGRGHRAHIGASPTTLTRVCATFWHFLGGLWVYLLVVLTWL